MITRQQPKIKPEIHNIFPPRQLSFFRSILAASWLGLVGMIFIVAVVGFLFPGLVRAQGEEEIVAGLYFPAPDEGQAWQAPTLKSDVTMTVSGLIADVRLRQRFRNPTDAWLEGVYIFPLPERSAVNKLTLKIGERLVKGTIMPREQAKKTYEQAASEGRRAGLVSSERPNVFTTAVANIAPGEEVVVEIGYQDRVEVKDGRYSLRFPMVVAPRYQPRGETSQAPNLVSQSQPKRRDPFGPFRAPEDGPGNPVTLVVDLDPGFALANLESRYHDVLIESAGIRRHIVTLAEGQVPADRDFVLEWRPRRGVEPQVAFFAEEVGGETFLLGLVEPGTDTEANTVVPPRDLIFVIDTSGSMHGPSIDQAVRALSLALGRLQPRDRFNIVRFASDMSSLFDRLNPASQTNIGRAKQFVASFTADGGTEMMPALLWSLSEPPVPGRLRQIVFLTDGAVGNDRELLALVNSRLAGARLFPVGIGSAPNSFFMRKAAELGRGSFTFIGDVTEVAQRMSALLAKLERPILTDIKARWPVVSELSVEAFPAPLRDLYQDEPVSFAARLPGQSIERLNGKLVLSGRHGERAWRREVDLSVLTSAPAVASIWAREKLAHILDGQYQGREPAVVELEATDLAVKHSLVSRFTSLVAVDDVVARPQEELLNTAEIPRNLPAGWSDEKVFGAGFEHMQRRQLPSGLQKAMGPGQPVSLPQGASGWFEQAMLGLGLLSLGLYLLLVASRLRHAR